MNARPTSSESLLSPRATSAITGGLSRNQLWRMYTAGQFPRPVALSYRRNGVPARIAWIESEVRAWIAARIAAERQLAPSPTPEAQA